MRTSPSLGVSSPFSSFKERRLSASVGPQQSDNFPGIQGKVEMIERGVVSGSASSGLYTLQVHS